MTVRRQRIILAVSVIGLSFLAGFFRAYHLPRLKNWILHEVEAQSRARSPIAIWPRDVGFSFWPLGLELKDIRLQPQGDLRKTLSVERVELVGAYLSLWGFFRGRLELGEIRVEGTDLTLLLKEQKDAQAGSFLDRLPPLDFELLDDVPVRSLHWQKIRVLARHSGSNLSIKVDDLGGSLELAGPKVYAQVQAKGFRLKQTNDPAFVDVDIDVAVKVSDRTIEVTRANVERSNSYLATSAVVDWSAKKTHFQRLRAKAKGNFWMPDIAILLREILPDHNMPQLTGRVLFEGRTDHTLGQKLEAELGLSSEALKINQLTVGDLKIDGAWKNDNIVVREIDLKHPGGHVNVANLDLRIDRKDGTSKVNASAHITGNKIHLANLLVGLGGKRVGLDSDLAPDLKCSGQVVPFSDMSCQGTVKVHSLRIDPAVEAKVPIVKLSDAVVAGDVRIDGAGVSFKSTLKTPRSSASGQGKVLFKEGFDIEFQSSQTDLKDLSPISGLELDGVLQLKGRTSGNSQAAGFVVDLQSKDFSFLKFGPTQLTSKASYQKGLLVFDNIDGLQRSTKYRGRVALDFPKKRMDIVGKIPFLDLVDIQDLIKNRWPLPFEVTGTGAADVRIAWPLEKGDPKIELKANVFRGLIAQESYDQTQINLTTDKGRIVAQSFAISKGSGQLSFLGALQPGGPIDGQIRLSNFRVEQSETLAKLGARVSGRADFSAAVGGTTLRPKVSGQGSIDNVVLGDKPVDRSEFEFSLDTRTFNGNMKLGRKTVEMFWNIGLVEGAPSNLMAQLRNWDLTDLVSAFSKSLRAESYTANLNGEIRLKSPGPRLEKPTGELTITDFLLRTDQTQLKNNGPMRVFFEGESFRSENFEVRGDDAFIRLKTPRSPGSALLATVEGQLDARIFSIATPFFDDLRGKLTLTMNWAGRLPHPTWTGQVNLQNGLVRAKGFPHALEDLSADVALDSKKIGLTSVRGRLGGGSITATGQVVLDEPRALPIAIQGQFIDSMFEVPPGFVTRGSGSFEVKGRGLPYTLQLNYDIMTGRVDKEIKPTVKNEKQVKPSAFLPKSLVARSTSSLNFDFDINLPQDLPVRLRVTRLDANAKINGRLRVLGPPEAPLLNGRLKVQKGSLITFRDNIFEVQSGYVEYQNSPPENPNLNITAESRVRTSVGSEDQREFDVLLRVLGPVQDPQVLVSSQPPLSEPELLSLLTLGFITQPDNTEAERLGRAQADGIANTSYQLGSAFLNEQLGLNREIGKRFGVDFDFSSAFNSQEQAAVHTFTARKQWTPKFGMSASRSVGKTQRSNVRAEYRLNNNFSMMLKYDGLEQSGASDGAVIEEDANVFGLDLEYRMDFK
jgi:translocation and assembly module TamB